MNTLGKAIFATVLPILSAAAVAQTAESSQNQTNSNDNLVLVVSLSDKRMAVVDHGAVRKIYPVAVGKPSTPSPTGTFRVISRVANPTYYHNGTVVLPGAGNPVGTRWIGLSERGYGIHGTNAPGSIGKAASHGCIRMKQRDLEELFAMLKTGEAVEIIGEPNEETASLFGTSNGTAKPASFAGDAATVSAAASTPVTTQAVFVTTMVGQ